MLTSSSSSVTSVCAESRSSEPSPEPASRPLPQVLEAGQWWLDLERWPGPVREGRKIKVSPQLTYEMDDEEVALLVRLNLKPEPGEHVSRYEYLDPWQYSWEIEDTW